MASRFCDVTVADFVQFDCGAELGGIIALILIDKNEAPSELDLRTRSYWVAKINASPTKWWVIKDTRGSYPGGTPVEEEGYGKTPTIRTGADHEMNAEVRGVLDNRSFWASVNQTDKWNVIAITAGDEAHYFTDASVYAKQVIDQSIKSTVRQSVNIKWSDDLSNPFVFDASPMVDLYTT